MRPGLQLLCPLCYSELRTNIEPPIGDQQSARAVIGKTVWLGTKVWCPECEYTREVKPDET